MAVGYVRSEFKVLGADWNQRGRLFDEAIDAMRAAWTGESVDIDGSFPAHGHTQLPPHIQPGGPPIWIRGNSERARRRAATKAQGWMPIARPPAMARVTKTPPLETFGELASMVADVQRRRRDLHDEPLDVCCLPFGDQRADGWIKALGVDLNAYEDAGVTWLILAPPARTLTEFRDSAGRLADDVLQGANGHAGRP